MSRRTKTLLIALAVVLVLAAVIGAASITYCCGEDGRSPDETAVERALRSFEKATRDADPEALVAVTTDAYIRRYFGNATDIGARAEEIGSILGRPVDRQIQSIKVTGDVATVDALQHVPGGTDNDAVRVGLVRKDGQWLVDTTGSRTGSVPSGSNLIEMELKDFSFGYDEAAFQRDKPFVIRAKNTGGQAHMVAIWKVPEDAVLIRVIEATDVLPEGTEKAVNSIVYEKGEEGDIIVKKGLKPGRYMLTCFLSDITTDVLTPHYDQGMLTEFKVK